ncbi:MAG: alpha/beta fold hydrolase [Gammaproteobacteria bacterium]|nr:alpha/beta fold hydrolase [Gammaproteobacteria bacterium]
MRWAVAATLAVVALAGCDQDGLNYERALDDGPSFSAYLVSYKSSGLRLHALVAVPNASTPADGFPVIVANHGYVPDPTRYGITAEGIDSRPGDYYRSVPELYASRGFLVVMPDYRGHNNSEGLEFTTMKQSVDYYAEDVIALLKLLGQVESVNPERVFMWSHSMGGAVTMRALLVTDLVRGASFWATTPLQDLVPSLENLDVPIIVHHSEDDASTASANSRALVRALEDAGHAHSLHLYEGSAHFLEKEFRELAADRDVAFFNALSE